MTTDTSPSPDLPPDDLPGCVLVQHSKYGPMLARWDKVRGHYIATGFHDGFVHGSNSPFIMVAIRDEQLELIIGWTPIEGLNGVIYS